VVALTVHPPFTNDFLSWHLISDRLLRAVIPHRRGHAVSWHSGTFEFFVTCLFPELSIYSSHLLLIFKIQDCGRPPSCKNLEIAISTQQFDQSPWNLSQWRVLTYLDITLSSCQKSACAMRPFVLDHLFKFCPLPQSYLWNCWS